MENSPSEQSQTEAQVCLLPKPVSVSQTLNLLSFSPSFYLVTRQRGRRIYQTLWKERLVE